MIVLSIQARARFKRIVVPLCAALVVLAAGSCGSNSRPQVVVYVAVDRANAEPILRRFEDESGIQVRAVYDAEAAKTTGLVSRLIAESARPRCDVFWNNEIIQTLLLKQKGMLQTYRPATAQGIPDMYRDPDGQWTGVASRCRVLVFNTQQLDISEAPKSIFELAEPRWRNRVAIADPQFGTTRTHFAALFAKLGPAEAKQVLAQIRDNGATITGGNAMVKNLVARAGTSETAIVVGLTDTDDVQSGQADGDPIEMVFPDQDGMGTLRIPTTVCCLRGAPHVDQAKQLIDFLVSQEAETMLAADESGYVPLRERIDRRSSPKQGDSVQAEPTSPESEQRPTGAPLAVPQRVFDVTFDQILDHLENSSRWAAESFHP